MLVQSSLWGWKEETLKVKRNFRMFRVADVKKMKKGEKKAALLNLYETMTIYEIEWWLSELL